MNMNVEEFYKEEKPYLWRSDLPQKDEGFYGKSDMIRFARNYHKEQLKLSAIPDVSKSVNCDHPRSKRSYIGKNLLRCNKCGKEFS